MTMPNELVTVPVQIQNWADVYAKPRVATRSTHHTWIIDNNGNAAPTFVQICEYEPNRLRMVVETIDSPVVITTSIPSKSPDDSTATVAPRGRHLDNNPLSDGQFFGPDAMWANSISGGAPTRVSVTKEYC